MDELKDTLLQLLGEYQSLGINQQIDYDKFYLYSLITHSTAIEGSTVTEIENQLLFDEGISAKGRSMVEQLMNLDLKSAYEASMKLAKDYTSFSVDMLKGLSALVMKNTGSKYSTLQGEFDSSKGDLRLVNVTAGTDGSSYMNFLKVPSRLDEYCRQMNERCTNIADSNDIIEKYLLSFDAHNLLVTIHPWVDGNGRMSRLIMNHLQFEYGLIPTKVAKDDKAEYIQALIDCRDQESNEPFREFMLREHIKNLRKEIESFQQTHDFDPINISNDTKDDTKDDTKKLSERQTNILRMLKDENSLTRQELAQLIGVSAPTIQRDLDVLKSLGMLKREGGKTYGHWIVLESDI